LSSKESDFKGIAVVCDPYGRILRILKNDLPDSLELPSDGSLTSVIDDNSMQKFFTFLYRMRREKALYDWSINVRGTQEVLELYFVGGMNGDEMIIVASTSKKVAGSYFEEVMRMNNEQTNLIRETMKQRSEAPSADAGGEEREIYDDFTRLNNELANLQRDLQKKNHMLEQTIKERDRYVGMAAHDLRNPLGAVSGIASLLLEGEFGELNDEQSEYLQMMKNSAEHMLEIVGQMLEISKHQTGTLELNWEEYDLMELVDRSIAVNLPIARRKRIEIVKETAVESLPLRIDRLKITQVLDNLLSNAVKYSFPDTTVILRVTESDSIVHTEVADQGQGIPEEEIPRLFEPFSRLSVRSTGGEKSTGLGLAICRRIIEGHGGTIEAESERGAGSTFRFTLPIRQ
jgi:signal transduction histidine kinase